jgi:hypothetical protein
MKRKKLSNKTKGKILIITPILLLVCILIAVFISNLISDFDSDGFQKMVIVWQTSGFFANGYHWPVIILLSLWVGLLLMRFIFDNVFPAFHFFIGKPFKYLTIWCICRKNGYSCRFRRVPFVSLKGVEEIADIEVEMDGKKLFIHFVDIPFPVLRMFLLVNDREYHIHRSLPGELQPGIGVRHGPRRMDHKNYNEYAIPDFPPRDTEYHCLVLDHSYADAYFMNGEIMSIITGECIKGDLIVCRWKILKKRLQSNLHAHFDSLKHEEDY